MKQTTALAALLGLTGVAIGAFGAHALKQTLLENAATEAWQTANVYHLIHVVALLAVTFSATKITDAFRRWITVLWGTGIVLFSGSIYALALGGPKILGPVTPLGGLCLIAGWTLLLVAACRKNSA